MSAASLESAVKPSGTESRRRLPSFHESNQTGHASKSGLPVILFVLLIVGVGGFPLVQAGNKNMFSSPAVGQPIQLDHHYLTDQERAKVDAAFDALSENRSSNYVDTLAQAALNDQKFFDDVDFDLPKGFFFVGRKRFEGLVEDEIDSSPSRYCAQYYESEGRMKFPQIAIFDRDTKQAICTYDPEKGMHWIHREQAPIYRTSDGGEKMGANYWHSYNFSKSYKKDLKAQMKTDPGWIKPSAMPMPKVQAPNVSVGRSNSISSPTSGQQLGNDQTMAPLRTLRPTASAMSAGPGYQYPRASNQSRSELTPPPIQPVRAPTARRLTLVGIIGNTATFDVGDNTMISLKVGGSYKDVTLKSLDSFSATLEEEGVSVVKSFH